MEHFRGQEPGPHRGRGRRRGAGSAAKNEAQVRIHGGARLPRLDGAGRAATRARVRGGQSRFEVQPLRVQHQRRREHVQSGQEEAARRASPIQRAWRAPGECLRSRSVQDVPDGRGAGAPLLLPPGHGCQAAHAGGDGGSGGGGPGVDGGRLRLRAPQGRERGQSLFRLQGCVRQTHRERLEQRHLQAALQKSDSQGGRRRRRRFEGGAARDDGGVPRVRRRARAHLQLLHVRPDGGG
mmetsp:Transcript_47690/g.91097  ORF Transcript_47690/g.91097 Transcript_47690/m.91097 type:complete len:238 (-) Transcript_47690:1207-1920(-)